MGLQSSAAVFINKGEGTGPRGMGREECWEGRGTWDAEAASQETSKTVSSHHELEEMGRILF